MCNLYTVEEKRPTSGRAFLGRGAEPIDIKEADTAKGDRGSLSALIMADALSSSWDGAFHA